MVFTGVTSRLPILLAVLVTFCAGHSILNDPTHGIDSPLCYPEGDYLCPDFRAATPRDIVVGRYPQGQWWLNATIMLANSGIGNLEVIPDVPPNATKFDQVTAYQVLKRRTPGLPDLLHEVGAIAFHPSHNHFHVDGVVQLHLCAPLDPDDLARGPDYDNIFVEAHKITFCMIDSENLLDAEEDRTFTRRGAAFNGCKGLRGVQGISPGFADNYPFFLNGNGFKINEQDQPTGTYYIVQEVNFKLKWIERANNKNKDTYNDNLSWIAIHLEWVEGKPTIRTNFWGGPHMIPESHAVSYISDHARDENGDNWPALIAKNTWYWSKNSGCNDCENDCCMPPNPLDIDLDESVGVGDLARVLSAWHPWPVYSNADIDNDQVVGVVDLALVLNNWGADQARAPTYEFFSGDPKTTGPPSTGAPTAPTAPLLPTEAPTRYPTARPTVPTPSSAPSAAPVLPRCCCMPTGQTICQEITIELCHWVGSCYVPPTAAPTGSPTTATPTDAPTNAPTPAFSTPAPSAAATTGSVTNAPTGGSITIAPTAAVTRAPNAGTAAPTAESTPNPTPAPTPPPTDDTNFPTPASTTADA